MPSTTAVSVVCLIVCSGILGLGAVQNYPTHICIHWTSGFCIGGDNALITTTVWLTYDYSEDNIEHGLDRLPLAKNTLENVTYSLTYASNSNNNNNNTGGGTTKMYYLFHQNEHGGGYCNCLDIYFDNNCTNSFSRFTLCGGSASLHRRMMIEWNSTSGNFLEKSLAKENAKTSPLQHMCSATNTTPYISATFLIVFNETGDCNTINEFNKGVEFSVRLLSMPEEWIPLRFIYHRDSKNHSEIYIGEKNNFHLRGYAVQTLQIDTGLHQASIMNVTIEVCHFNASDSMQFRWLQTSYFVINTEKQKDIWILDYIGINAVTSNFSRMIMLNESFENDEIDPMIWPQNHIRNGNLSDFCNYNNGFVFGLGVIGPAIPIIISRSMLTNVYNLSDFIISSIAPTSSRVASSSDTQFGLTSSSVMLSPTSTIQLSETPTVIQTGTIAKLIFPAEISLEALEKIILDLILSNVELKSILDAEDPVESLMQLDSVSSSGTVHPLVSTYMFSSVVDRLMNATFSMSSLEVVLGAGDGLLSPQQMNMPRSAAIVGTTVLESYDNVLFTYVPEEGTFVTNNTILNSTLVNFQNGGAPNQVVAIDTSTIEESTGPQVAVTIPLELVKQFSDGSGMVRVASGLYKNVSELFTLGLSSRSNSTIVSDIVSSSLQCGNEKCPTDNLTLQSNVTILFEHSDSLMQLLLQGDMETTCVFLEVPPNNGILSIGRWSDKGCAKNASLSSLSRTVCDCNHLTSFAILLSSIPPNLTLSEQLSLSLISYIGVTISVFAMAVTVITLTIQTLSLKERPLLTIRNYIHINLCISLAIAQIIFVVGIDLTGPPNGDVPIHCQVIAVLLHYFFLVAFMWMLMEGVVLYLALVRVFVTRQKSYIIAFTVTSYGLPLLYMGSLTLPLAFGLFSEPQYGYDKACFLRASTYFVWAFIAPVILIFLTNIGFFIMAARISWQQHMRKVENKTLESVLSWLKSTIPLVVVMGLTWVIGLLVLHVSELIFLAYIYTIMVAFQGLFIFLVLIVLSRAIRDYYSKCYRSKFSLSNKTPNQLITTSKWNGTTGQRKMISMTTTRTNSNGLYSKINDHSRAQTKCSTQSTQGQNGNHTTLGKGGILQTTL